MSSGHQTQTHTHLQGVLFKDTELQEDVQFDPALMENLLHMSLSLIQLLKNTLDMSHGAGMRQLITGQRWVPVWTNTNPRQHIQEQININRGHVNSEPVYQHDITWKHLFRTNLKRILLKLICKLKMVGAAVALWLTDLDLNPVLH